MATQYLSVKQVALILKISERTVYKKIHLGEIPGHFTLGSMHFIDEEEFRSCLKKKATEPKQTASSNHQRRTEDRHGLMK